MIQNLQRLPPLANVGLIMFLVVLFFLNQSAYREAPKTLFIETALGFRILFERLPLKGCHLRSCQTNWFGHSRKKLSYVQTHSRKKNISEDRKALGIRAKKYLRALEIVRKF